MWNAVGKVLFPFSFLDSLRMPSSHLCFSSYITLGHFFLRICLPNVPFPVCAQVPKSEFPEFVLVCLLLSLPVNNWSPGFLFSRFSFCGHCYNPEMKLQSSMVWRGNTQGMPKVLWDHKGGSQLKRGSWHLISDFLEKCHLN